MITFSPVSVKHENMKNALQVCFKKPLPAKSAGRIHQCGRSLSLSDSVSAYEMEHLQKLPESM